MNNLHLHIVRHGESEANKANKDHPDNRVFGGDTDYPLTDLGRDEARALRDQFRERGVHFDRIFSSPLQRAIETAEIIVGDLSRIEIIPALTERRLGVLTGQTARRIYELYPALRDELTRDPALRSLRESVVGIPELGIEGYADVLLRVKEAMDLPLSTHTNNAQYLLVAHKHSNRMLLHSLLRPHEADLSAAVNLDLRNADPVELLKHDDAWFHVQGLDSHSLNSGQDWDKLNHTSSDQR